MSETIYTISDINIADPIELRIMDTSGRTVRRYKSLIQNIDSNGIAISMPTHKRRLVPLKANHMVEISIFRGFTTHIFVSRVLQRLGGKRPSLLLSIPPDHSIRRIPRRDYFRVATEIPIEITSWDTQSNKSVQQATIIDLSIGGCRIVLNNTLVMESSVELDLELPLPASQDGIDLTRPLTNLAGMVRDLTPIFLQNEDGIQPKPDHFLIGVEFILRAKHERDKLLRYVTFRQRQLRQENPLEKTTENTPTTEDTLSDETAKTLTPIIPDPDVTPLAPTSKPNNDTIPLSNEDIAEPKPPPDLFNIRPPNGTANGKTILITEDEAAIREILAETLQYEGYHILVAAHGAEALQIAQHIKVDLIVTDLMMPQMNGWRLITKLRENGLDLPVIVITGYMYEEGDELLQNHDITGFLVKPIDLQDLISQVNTSLFPNLLKLEKKMRVLLLNDGEFIQSLADDPTMLEEFDVDLAQNLLDAIKKTNNFQPDIVLLDIATPDLDGFEFCRKIRARTVTSSLPIMFLSPPPKDYQIREAIDLKINAYLSKPVTRDVLLGRLRNLIQTC